MTSTLFSLRVQILLRIIIAWFIGLALTFWPLLWIGSGFLKPRFAPAKVRDIKRHWQFGIATAAGAYLALATFSISKTVLAERRWFQRWKRLEEDNANFRWPQDVRSAKYKPSDDVTVIDTVEKVLELMQTMPKHNSLWLPTSHSSTLTGVCPTNQRAAMRGWIIGGALVKLKATGLPSLIVATDKSFSTLLVHAPVPLGDNITAYATGALVIELLGDRLMLTSSGSTCYVFTKHFLNTQDQWVKPDAWTVAAMWVHVGDYMFPFSCLKYIPGFLLSILRGWPFTDGLFRKRLSLERGLCGEHNLVTTLEERPWKIPPHEQARLNEVLDTILKRLCGHSDECLKTLKNLVQSIPPRGFPTSGRLP